MTFLRTRVKDFSKEFLFLKGFLREFLSKNMNYSLRLLEDFLPSFLPNFVGDPLRPCSGFISLIVRFSDYFQ
jgi:hypothetical protein